MARSRRARIEPLEERQLLSIDLVSIAPPSLSGNFGSYSPSISGDGRYVAFSSDATNLVASDVNGKRDVFVVDRTAGTTALVSTAGSSGAANDASDLPSISSDGRYVAFESKASNLVLQDSNGVADVFVRDLVGGNTIRVSTDSDGEAGTKPSSSSSLSGDGRYVAFQSNANLASGCDTDSARVFVKDLATGATVLASIDASGNPSVGFLGSISGDGRFVAFASGNDSFVRDMAGGGLVSLDGGFYGSSWGAPTLSGDGRYVVFGSTASGLVPDDTDTAVDLFRYDLLGGTTARVTGAGSNPRSPTVSSDGRYVAFEDVRGDMIADVFVKDMVEGTARRVATECGGYAPGLYQLGVPCISDDGRFVAYQSPSNTMASPDTNNAADVFLANCATGEVSLTSERWGDSSMSGGGNGDSSLASVSSDGRYVTFLSRASDLGVADANGSCADVYFTDLVTGTTARIEPMYLNDSWSPVMSPDGRYVALTRGEPINGGVRVKDTWSGGTTWAGAPTQYYYGTVPLEPRGQIPSLSNDGRYVAVAGTYSYAHMGATIQWTDVYVNDLETGSQRQIVDLFGVSSVETRISGDGRWVAYTNGAVYMYDLGTGTTTTASSDSQGVAASGADPTLSNDGRYVAFISEASSLVADDTNGLGDVFLKDMLSGVTIRLSTDATGGQANGRSFSPCISGDGRYVTFTSDADNLVPGDTNGHSDIFVKDLASGAIARVSMGSTGEEANGDCGEPAISSNGRYIVFQSTATNLHPSDTTSYQDVYLVWNPLIPAELSLYGTTVAENRPVGTEVGVLATGASSSGPFTYMLVAGEGDADNGAFTIDGNTLRTAATFDFETRAAYTIRVRSTDGGSVCCEQSFTITVDDVHPIACPALYDPETSFFSLRGANNGESNDTSFGYGEPGADWVPLMGDWNGDQASGVGFYDPEGSCFYLTDSHEGGYSQYAFGYGEPGAGWIPLVGDWNGDGRSGVGLYNPHTSTFYLTDSLVDGFAQYTFGYGEPDAGWSPLVGDWDGDGSSGVALYDPHSFAFYLTDSLQTGIAEHYYRDANAKAGWQPLVGDWDGDGSDGLGLYAPESSVFHLVSVTATRYVPYSLGYGQPGAGWQPLVGDWDGNGACGVGLYDPATATFYLKDRLTSGFADYTYVFGTPGAAQVLIGRWTTTEAEVAAQAVDQLDLAGLAEEELGALAVMPTTP
jgi:Tol biopolymer transport system component